MLDANMKETLVKQANRDFFETAADNYDKITGLIHSFTKASIAGKIDSIIESAGPERLLDLCCGTGFFTSCVREKFYFTCGVDIAFNMLKRYQRVSRGICADVCSLPFKDGVFSVVACSGGLHHIYDFEPLLKEAYRTLKKGGLLYLESEIDKRFVERFYFFVKLYRIFFGVNKKYLKDPRVNFRDLKLAEYHNTFCNGIDPVDLKEELSRIGFSKIEIKYYYNPGILSPFFSILAVKDESI